MKKTDKNGTHVPFVFLFILVILFSCSRSPEKERIDRKNTPGSITVETFRLDSLKGWGYEIVVDKRIYIHQEYIPALAGNRVFLSREDALKTGNRVKEKLAAGKSPTLSKEEVLTLLGIRE